MARVGWRQRVSERPCSEQLREILRDVQQSVDNHCKHGVLLCECSDDCPDCFEEALRRMIFATEELTLRGQRLG